MKIRKLRFLSHCFPVIILLLPFIASGQQKYWTLKDCIEYALENNVAYKQQKLVSEISKINLDQSKMNRLPNLSFSDAQSFSFGNSVNSSSYTVNHQNTNSNLPALNSTVVLFNGMKYANLVKENNYNYESSQLDIETQKNNLELSITAAYEQVLFENEVVSIAQQQIVSDSIEIKRTELFVAVGQTPEDSLLVLQAQMAADKSAKVTAETQVVLAYVQLSQLMEKPISMDFRIEIPANNEPSPDLILNAADVYNTAASIFPDEKSAALKTKASETDLLVTKSALLPSLSLTGGLSSEYYSALSKYSSVYQNEVIGYLQNTSQPVIGPIVNTTTQPYPFFNQFKDNFSQVIALSLSVPIFNNYKAQNNIRLSKIAVLNARLNEQAVKNNLRKNVETACANQLAGSKNYVATKEQLVAETKAYENMKRKYNVGLANITDYLIEQNNYFRALMANLQSKYTYVFQTKVVNFYTGTSLIQ